MKSKAAIGNQPIHRVLVLAVGAWIGGKLVQEERVGMIEAPTEDRRAKEFADSADERPRRVASAR